MIEPIFSVLQKERASAREMAMTMRGHDAADEAYHAALRRGLDVIHVKMTNGKITVTYNGKTNIPEVKRRK